MKEIRPYMPHELDVHPDKLRIEATIKQAVESETVFQLQAELDFQIKSKLNWINLYVDSNKKLSRIKQALDGII